MLLNIKSGTSYGKLEAVKRLPNDEGGNQRWVWQCRCGQNIALRASNVKRVGPEAACPDCSLRAEQGSKEGELVAVRPDGTDLEGYDRWIFRCDCGAEVRWRPAWRRANLRLKGRCCCPACARVKKAVIT